MAVGRAILALAIAAGLATMLPRQKRALPPRGHVDARRRLARSVAFFDATDTGAITRIDVPEADIFAFRVHGVIARRDVRAMARLLTAAFDALGRIDVLITMPSFGGIEPAAALDPDMARAMARSNRHIRRYAVVGPPTWAATMIRAFDPLTPVEARTFAMPEEAEAWDWVRAGRAAPSKGASGGFDGDGADVARPSGSAGPAADAPAAGSHGATDGPGAAEGPGRRGDAGHARGGGSGPATGSS